MIDVNRATSILSLGFIGMGILFAWLPKIALLNVEVTPAIFFFGWLFVPQYYWPTGVEKFDRPLIYIIIFWILGAFMGHTHYLPLFTAILVPQLAYNTFLKNYWAEPQAHCLKLYICVVPIFVFCYLVITQQFNWLAWAMISATNILSIIIALKLIHHFFYLIWRKHNADTLDL